LFIDRLLAKRVTNRWSDMAAVRHAIQELDEYPDGSDDFLGERPA
jgi:hypothetical protein